MFLRVTQSPAEIPQDTPLDEMDIEAIRFMDERQRSAIDLLRETCYELAQYQTRCEILENRLKKYEPVDEFEPKPYTHTLVSL